MKNSLHLANDSCWNYQLNFLLVCSWGYPQPLEFLDCPLKCCCGNLRRSIVHRLREEFTQYYRTSRSQLRPQAQMMEPSKCATTPISQFIYLTNHNLNQPTACRYTAIGIDKFKWINLFALFSWGGMIQETRHLWIWSLYPMHPWNIPILSFLLRKHHKWSSGHR